MAGRFYLATDPAFSEYVFHCMSNAPRERVLALDQFEMRHFKTERAIRLFADQASMEARLYMLTRLNYSYCVVVADRQTDVGRIFNDIPKAITPELKVSVVEAMAKNRMFVISSRNILSVAHLAAMNTHGQVYVLDYEYVKLHKSLRENGIDPYNDQVKDGQKGLAFMASFAINALASKGMIQMVSGVSETDMRILLVLYRNQNAFVRMEVIAAALGESTMKMTTKEMARQCTSLKQRGYVAMHVMGKTRSYAIMEPGIEACSVYLRFLIKKADT